MTQAKINVQSTTLCQSRLTLVWNGQKVGSAAHAPDDLVEVAPGRRRVCDGETDGLLRVDDKNCTDLQETRRVSVHTPARIPRNTECKRLALTVKGRPFASRFVASW